MLYFVLRYNNQIVLRANQVLVVLRVDKKVYPQRKQDDLCQTIQAHNYGHLAQKIIARCEQRPSRGKPMKCLHQTGDPSLSSTKKPPLDSLLLESGIN